MFDFYDDILLLSKLANLFLWYVNIIPMAAYYSVHSHTWIIFWFHSQEHNLYAMKMMFCTIFVILMPYSAVMNKRTNCAEISLFLPFLLPRPLADCQRSYMESRRKKMLDPNIHNENSIYKSKNEHNNEQLRLATHAARFVIVVRIRVGFLI